MMIPHMYHFGVCVITKCFGLLIIHSIVVDECELLDFAVVAEELVVEEEIINIDLTLCDEVMVDFGF